MTWKHFFGDRCSPRSALPFVSENQIKYFRFSKLINLLVLMEDDLIVVILLFCFFIRIFVEDCCCFFWFAFRRAGDFESSRDS